MDFLLECIGFPPDTDLDDLARRVAAQGEPTAYRGPHGVHLRLPLAEGLELRLDRETQDAHASLWPHFAATYRLRVAHERLRRIPDQPFDVLLDGIANPPVPGGLCDESELYRLACYLTDARRLPRRIAAGHVIAVSIAGFALDVSFIGPEEEAPASINHAHPSGARIAPLGSTQDPGGCMDISVRVRSVRHIRNPITGVAVDLVEAEAPGRPLQLFVSQWQLGIDDMPAPHPGLRLEGVFVFTGRVAGGLPSLGRASSVPVFG